MFFILGRTVAGLGSSGLENGALTLVAGAVPLHKRPCKSQAAQLDFHLTFEIILSTNPKLILNCCT